MVELAIAGIIMLVMVASWFILPAGAKSKPTVLSTNESVLPQAAQPQVS